MRCQAPWREHSPRSRTAACTRSTQLSSTCAPRNLSPYATTPSRTIYVNAPFFYFTLLFFHRALPCTVVFRSLRAGKLIYQNLLSQSFLFFVLLLNTNYYQNIFLSHHSILTSKNLSSHIISFKTKPQPLTSYHFRKTHFLVHLFYRGHFNLAVRWHQ